VTGAGATRPALLRQRNFLLLWAGQAVSETGSQVTVLALPLVAIVTLKASALQVGLLSTAVTCAYLLVSLPAGVLADRVGKRRLMCWSDLAQLIVIGSVPAAQAAGALTLGQLYGVALASGVLSTAFMIAWTSYLPDLLAPDQLLDGNGKLRTSASFAQLGGPGLGAVLVGALGAAGAMSADALSYAVSAVSLLLIRAARPRHAAARRRDAAARQAGMGRQIAEGLRYVLRDPILRRYVAWNGSANFFVIMVETLGPLYLIRSVRLPPAYVGVLLALGAAGGIAGGVCSGALSRRIGSARIGWLSMTVFALPGLLIPLAQPGWRVLLFAAGWMSWTFSSTLCGVALVSYQQRTCPPGLRGRVSASTRWATWGMLPLGGLAAGALGTALGVHTALWLAVAGGCLSGLWLYFSPLRRLRDLPAQALQPSGA
jgi:MFS family permease